LAAISDLTRAETRACLKHESEFGFAQVEDKEARAFRRGLSKRLLTATATIFFAVAIKVHVARVGRRAGNRTSGTTDQRTCTGITSCRTDSGTGASAEKPAGNGAFTRRCTAPGKRKGRYNNRTHR
jgi:hypothetical protein